ncbi:MAG: ATP synthase F1 subunit gamma [Polyangiaceae bacterium]
MPSLKAIRKRISSVKSTQKITRAMKMVAGARLNRAQQRITELRPYAVKTTEVLSEITSRFNETAQGQDILPLEPGMQVVEQAVHPLLATRPEARVALVVMSGDRGLCGAFNANVNKRAEREWKTRREQGQEVKLLVIGRKGRDYLLRRGAEIEFLPDVWNKLGLDTAKLVGEKVLAPFLKKEVDAIYLVYNEFKSAMSQNVVCERLLPVPPPPPSTVAETPEAAAAQEFIFEPDKTALLEALAPMYVDISILRALYESQASFLGAQMTAMDSATKNASEMIEKLSLQYNKARQALITKELMEIIGGSEAIKE